MLHSAVKHTEEKEEKEAICSEPRRLQILLSTTAAASSLSSARICSSIWSICQETWWSECFSGKLKRLMYRMIFMLLYSTFYVGHFRTLRTVKYFQIKMKLICRKGKRQLKAAIYYKVNNLFELTWEDDCDCAFNSVSAACFVSPNYRHRIFIRINIIKVDLIVRFSRVTYFIKIPLRREIIYR